MRKADLLSIISKCMLAVFVFILVHALYDGIISKPVELDSLYYHIPIARGMLDGTVLHPTEKITLQQFFPGSSEAILSLFILLHIPLNTYNVLGVAMFAGVLYLLGKRVKLSSGYALIFAVTVAGMVGITRWMDTQIIDIWMGIWYVLLLVLLEKPHKSLSYSLRLGAVAGMVIGSKYSGLFYIIPVIFVYRKEIVPVLGNFKRFIAFLMPFGVLGLFWYLRNYLVAGNPIYPMSIFGMPGIRPYVFAVQTWEALLRYPVDILTAILSEWGLWGFAFLLVPFYFRHAHTNKVYFLAAANIVVFLLLPSGAGYPLYVSNLRYAVSTAVPLILSAFLHLKTKGWEKYIVVAAFAQILFSVRVAYHPKLLVALIPLTLVIFFPELINGGFLNKKIK